MNSLKLFNFLRQGRVIFRSFSNGTDNKWFGNLFVRKLDSVHESQSDLLSKSEALYEFQIHSVKPQCMKQYLSNYSNFIDINKSKQTGAEIMGSWTTEIGEQDTAYHLWRYKDFNTLDKHYKMYRKDSDFDELRKQRNEMLRSRKNQICFPFSYWPIIEPRSSEESIYELRSYTLKPGTMIEWGNHWAKGIRVRNQHSIPIAGLFTHVGDIHVVHHIWAYQNMEHRKKMRHVAWEKPGWDECVLYTVPLIRHMKSNILRSTPFSPIN